MKLYKQDKIKFINLNSAPRGDMESNKATKKKLVSIIIVNYNGLNFLEDCFKTIFKQTYENIEAIMVDNASSDSSVEFVKNNFPQVKIIISKENLGYAGGNNLGLKECKGEYIMILNNDVYLQKDLVEKLLEAYNKIPNLGAVQPMVQLMNDKGNLDACGSFWTNTGFNYHYGIYKNANLAIYNKAFPIYSLKGVCMLMPRMVIEKIGLFDGDFWTYFEETDFCHRVWLAGFECWYYPKSFLYHHMGATRLKKTEAFVQFHSFKNRLCSYFKNLGEGELFKILPIYLILNVGFSFVYLLKMNFSCFFMIYKAIWWNIKNFRSTLKKRKYIQSTIRKKTDKEIFSKIKKNPRISYYFYLIKDLKNYAD